MKQAPTPGLSSKNRGGESFLVKGAPPRSSRIGGRIADTQRESFLRKAAPRRRNGVTLVEMIGAFVILTFVTLGTAQLYNAGTRQQRNARFYSNAQTDLKEALRRITRTIRHSSAVQMSSGVSNFSSAPNSSASQIIVAVPQANGSGTDYIRIYRDSSGNVYAQRNNDVGSGTKLMDGPSALTFTYYQTKTASSGTSTTDVTSGVGVSPSSATEVQVTLSATRGSITTQSIAYVEMRNTVLGL